MEGHCWRHTSCIDKVAARSLLISRLITALPMPRTSAALNILHQIERESSDPWQIESMRNGQECKLRRSNQRSWWMQGPGPEAIHWNTWLGVLPLKLLRNYSVYGIFMMRRLFLKKFRSAAFVQIAAICWWGKFQFLYQSYFGTNFPWTRFAHNWSIYKVLWPQLQTLFNISNSSWRHNYPESSAFVTKKCSFAKSRLVFDTRKVKLM